MAHFIECTLVLHDCNTDQFMKTHKTETSEVNTNRNVTSRTQCTSHL